MKSRMICVTVTFLTGRYHGDEWPPSPARLYQAIVAGVMTCGYREYAAAVEPMLRWLERQSPPAVRVCASEDESHYRIAVPNNDMDVVARNWVCGRAVDPSVLKTMKNVCPRRVEARGPHVQYMWKVDADEAVSMVGPLRTAARCLHTLGWGVDMAYADLGEEPIDGAVFEPATTGDGFSVPVEGTLDDLYATYERFSRRATGEGVDTNTRPSMLGTQAYRMAGEVICPMVRFLLMKPDVDESRPVAWEDCMTVAGWLRHAAAERLRQEYDASFVERYVQGHTEADEKSHRISYVPLPSIYGRFGDGLIRRALVVEPPNTSGEIARMLELKLTGWVLSDNTNQPVCCLGPAEDKDWTFEQYLPRTAKTVWRTVTPVVLHGHNLDRRGAISVSKTERLLLRSFEMAGYSEKDIVGFAFQGAPFWRGSKHASAMRVPDHLTGYPRVHVEVRFKRGVRGPVLAGIGRHYGIGLFAIAD